MRNMRRHRWLGILASFMAFSLLFVGCSDDDPTGPAEEAPPLPPQSSFVMNFDDFDRGDGVSPLFGKRTQSETKDYWFRAAFQIGIWDALLNLALIVPAASFVAAFGQDPVWQPEDNSWNWAYSFTAGGVEHSAVLNGRVDGDQVFWIMTISKESEYTDFEWYTGISQLDRSAGSWNLNHSPTDPRPFLAIEWTYDDAADTGTLKYTNVIPENPNNGGYISYGSTTDNEYDRFYNLYNVPNANLVEIEWHHIDGDGRIRDPHFYGDNNWRCWDESQNDVECP